MGCFVDSGGATCGGLCRLDFCFCIVVLRLEGCHWTSYGWIPSIRYFLFAHLMCGVDINFKSSYTIVCCR